MSVWDQSFRHAPQGCTERTLDAFVTKEADELNDEYVGSVWSVVVHGNTAVVINEASDWVTWCTGEGYDLKEGDLVRIGTSGTETYTGILTVLECRDITGIQNGTQVNGTIHPEIKFGRDVLKEAETDTPLRIIPDGFTQGIYASGMFVAVQGATVQMKAYRINALANFTLIAGTPFELQHLTGAQASLDEAKLQRRHTFAAGGRPYYPLYKVKRWLTDSGEISVRFDTGVKRLNWIKLIAYSMFDTRRVGYQHAHEAMQDDWIALRIGDVEGEVVSNNDAARGAFAILHAGGRKDTESGALEYYEKDRDGLFCVDLTRSSKPVQELRLKFTDPHGMPAHFGRMHLWFRVNVTHG